MNIKVLLNRSDQFRKELDSIINLELDEPSNRTKCCSVVCSFTIEHADSLRVLLRNDLATSAICILRVQFEGFVRAAWILHAASDEHVNLMMDTELLLEEKKVNSLPMLSDMINQLEGASPEGMIDIINDFKTASWKYLSSHIHGGYYALQLHGRGIPLEHKEEVLRMSNALLNLTGLILCSLSLNYDGLSVLRNTRNKYADCMPRLIE